jgi:DNA helicase-2/ATP-dependent DNA helicase PcrA
MIERLEALLGAYGRSVTTGTFHSVAAQLLRQYMHEVPGARQRAGFTIYDKEDSASALRRALEQLGLKDSGCKPADFQSLVSRAKNALPCAYKRTGGEAFDALVRVGAIHDKGDWRETVFKQVFDAYNAALGRANALDYDDLISFAVAALSSSPTLAGRLAQRWPHVLIDEFQDTSLTQYELVRSITSGGAGGVHAAALQQECQRSLLVVGDSDQSIYSWRGAQVQLMRERFTRDMRAASTPLAANYRSTPQICAAAEAVLAGSPERSELRVRAVSASGPPVAFWTAGSVTSEAIMVADEIARLLQTGLHGADIAVLYRMSWLSRGIEAELLKRNIKHIVVGGTAFFARSEIKDVMCYLRLVYNANDSVAFHRIVNTPTRGITDDTVDKLGCARA